MRRYLQGAALAWCIASLPVQLHAQRAEVSSLDSARAATPAKEKSPATATVLGFVPGVGHLYAEDINRGWLIMAVYWTGVAITHNGRTDAVGKVGGAMLVGGLVYSVVDAGRAARRHNARIAKLKNAASGSGATQEVAVHPPL